MDRMITARINGEERPLNYSIEVMFLMTEKYGDIKTALETIGLQSKEGFEAVRWFAVKMANDGELCRRDAGYDPRPFLKEKDLTMRMKPKDYEELCAAVAQAITAGYLREIQPDESEEVDLGLLELEKKTEAGSGKHD